MRVVHLQAAPWWTRRRHRHRFPRRWFTEHGFEVRPPVADHPVGQPCPACSDEIAVNGGFVLGEDVYDAELDA